MQDEDIRQFDTTGKWLQFVYCLPSFLCVILFSLGQKPAKMRNISRPWPNLSSSKGSQDTSACQISGHNCHAFSIKYGNHIFEMFHWVKMPPKLVKSTDRDHADIWSHPGTYLVDPYAWPWSPNGQDHIWPWKFKCQGHGQGQTHWSHLRPGVQS